MTAMFFISTIITLEAYSFNLYNQSMKKNSTAKKFLSAVITITVLSGIFLLPSCKAKKLREARQAQNAKELMTHQNGRDIMQYIKTVREQKNSAVWEFISKLSLEEKIGQLFVVNIVGGSSFVPVEENIAGGFLYFGYNIAETPEAMIDFNKSVNNYCFEHNKIPPFLAADQEGGYVTRLSSLNGTLPSQEKVAQLQNPSIAKRLYELQALQMKNLGFNMNLAPVVEVCTPDNEKFLNKRSFGSLDDVQIYGTDCVRAYEDNGVGTVIKHFPGNTNTDPHTGLPQIEWEQDEFDMQMNAFCSIILQEPAGVLMSHARVKAHDELVPACLSKYWVTDILRNEFGYKGIVFSDDIFMQALAGNGYPPEKAAVMAIQAGIDCIMISEKRIGSCVEILCKNYKADSDFAVLIEKAVQRIIDYKIKNGILIYELNALGKYELKVNTALNDGFDGEAFAAAREENMELYRNNF